MDAFIINGGNKLNGEVAIQSAKNSVLLLMAGAILTDEDVIIRKCPRILDVFCMIDILKGLNCKVYWVNNDELFINAKEIKNVNLCGDLCGKMRASIFLLGALISRFGQVRIAYPGGCKIGERPINIHLNMLKALGCEVFYFHNEVLCKLTKKKCATYCFPKISVGATENAILSTIFFNGRVRFINCAKEPEIVDLQNFLNKMGANVRGAGTNVVEVDGVKKLHGIEYIPINDRIELGTFLIATAICGGKIRLFNANKQNICYLIDKILNNTCKISMENDIMNITVCGKRCLPKFIETAPYPYFPTDLQSQYLSMALFANGSCMIKENVFQTRFSNVEELQKMGAKIFRIDNCVYVEGKQKLNGANLISRDLRGGAGLVLAGLGVKDVSILTGIEFIDRGYFDFEGKLSQLGANIKRIKM